MMDQLIDIPKILLATINPIAVVLGVAVVQIIKLAIPSPEGGGKLDALPGHWGSRLLPFAPVVVACVATIALEWDGKFNANDAVRGIMSGWATEFALRIYYKTFRAV